MSNGLDIFEVRKDSSPDIPITHKDFVQLPCCMAICGKSKAGKSNLLVNFLLRPSFGDGKHSIFEQVDTIHLYSSTAHGGDPSIRALTELIPSTTYSNYSDKHLKKIIEDSLDIPKDKRPKAILIFDDIGQFNATKNSLLFQVSGSYRHSCVMLIYLVQKFKMLSPMARNNIDYYTFSNIQNEHEREDIAEELSGVFGGKNNFLEHLDEATKKDYNFLFCKPYEKPPELWENFTKLIYVGDGKGRVKIQQPNLGKRKEEKENLLLDKRK